jgi:hypothetical protein
LRERKAQINSYSDSFVNSTSSIVIHQTRINLSISVKLTRVPWPLFTMQVSKATHSSEDEDKMWRPNTLRQHGCHQHQRLRQPQPEPHRRHRRSYRVANMGTARWTPQEKEIVEKIFGVRVNVRHLMEDEIAEAVDFNPHLEKDLPDFSTDSDVPQAEVEAPEEVKSDEEDLAGFGLDVSPSKTNPSISEIVNPLNFQQTCVNPSTLKEHLNVNPSKM